MKKAPEGALSKSFCRFSLSALASTTMPNGFALRRPNGRAHRI
jgi:hypothetical protein